jgi:hypothetical protein
MSSFMKLSIPRENEPNMISAATMTIANGIALVDPARLKRKLITTAAIPQPALISVPELPLWNGCSSSAQPTTDKMLNIKFRTSRGIFSAFAEFTYIVFIAPDIAFAPFLFSSVHRTAYS